MLELWFNGQLDVAPETVREILSLVRARLLIYERVIEVSDLPGNPPWLDDSSTETEGSPGQ